MLKGTKLYSVLKLKCPRCQEGDFFESHPYHLSEMGHVKTRCSNCQQKFEIETGFYQGSYYVSYGLGVALFIAVVVLNYLIRDELTPASLFISFVLALFFLIPLLFALSKIIWANLFIKFEKESKSVNPLKHDSTP